MSGLQDAAASCKPDQLLEKNHSTKYHTQQPLYNTLELLTCKRIALGSNICVRRSSEKHLCSYLTYIVASKYFRNHLISEEYKTANHLGYTSSKTVPLKKLYNSGSNCKGVGNIHGSKFVKAFPALSTRS